MIPKLYVRNFCYFVTNILAIQLLCDWPSLSPFFIFSKLQVQLHHIIDKGGGSTYGPIIHFLLLIQSIESFPNNSNNCCANKHFPWSQCRSFIPFFPTYLPTPFFRNNKWQRVHKHNNSEASLLYRLNCFSVPHIWNKTSWYTLHKLLSVLYTIYPVLWKSLVPC